MRDLRNALCGGEIMRVPQLTEFGLYHRIPRAVLGVLVTPDKPGFNSRINEPDASLASAASGCDEVSRVSRLVLSRAIHTLR